MKTLWITTGAAMATALLVAGCSPKIYKPPALGAEYQFDRGLPPAKKPAHLFDKKMEKDLAEKGMLPGESRHKTTTVSTGEKAATRPDSTKIPPPPAAPQDSAANTTLTPAKKQE